MRRKRKKRRRGMCDEKRETRIEIKFKKEKMKRVEVRNAQWV